MTQKYFGTDGIRGTANCHPVTAEVALRVAMAATAAVRAGGSEPWRPHQNRVVIGKDTRLSGYMLEEAMAAGFVSVGMDVVLVGPIPTPAIAMLTRSLRADLGVMISASHNPYQDNGIKIFGADGYKLPDSLERAIEERLESGQPLPLASSDAVGKASRLDDALGRYVEFIKGSLPRRTSLEGMKIVLDCANGAGYKAAPQALWELGAEIVPMAVTPNGRNINEGCGATDTAALEARVVAEGAHIGLALDGDADRLIVVDETGARVDGDQIMAMLARRWKTQDRLKGGGVVATVMSNLGLERYLADIGLTLVRTPVGDRHVVEKMREGGFNLGGEQSGHVILSDYGTTGDGILTALQVLSAIRDDGRPASVCLGMFEPLPQILRNVRYGRDLLPLSESSVREAIEHAAQTLARDGRILVRSSGTEPLIRVMAEGEDRETVEKVVTDVCAAIEKAAGPA
ncbi:MAG TPA: phosphoglucosamine mutase [Alphaproteobacteria bacterium]|nr:phosphoglucosamine mutase [Alphaproteobacteria bacterium]